MQIYTDLPSCLDSLKKDVPPLDKRDLATRLDHEITSDLLKFASDKEFELGAQLRNFSVSGFVTEEINMLALSFELTYEAYDLSQDERTVSATDLLIVKGNCTFNDATKALADVRLESFEYVRSDGELVGPKGLRTVYASAVIGRGQIQYQFRQPIE